MVPLVVIDIEDDEVEETTLLPTDDVPATSQGLSSTSAGESSMRSKTSRYPPFTSDAEKGIAQMLAQADDLVRGPSVYQIQSSGSQLNSGIAPCGDAGVQGSTSALQLQPQPSAKQYAKAPVVTQLPVPQQSDFHSMQRANLNLAEMQEQAVERYGVPFPAITAATGAPSSRTQQPPVPAQKPTNGGRIAHPVVDGPRVVPQCQSGRPLYAPKGVEKPDKQFALKHQRRANQRGNVQVARIRHKYGNQRTEKRYDDLASKTAKAYMRDVFMHRRRQSAAAATAAAALSAAEVVQQPLPPVAPIVLHPPEQPSVEELA